MFKEIMRVLMVASKVGTDIAQGTGLGIVYGVTNRRLPPSPGLRAEFNGIKADVSNLWHSTLRPKGYQRPREIGEAEVMQAQREQRASQSVANVKEMENRPAPAQEVTYQPRPTQGNTMGQAPTMHM